MATIPLSWNDPLFSGLTNSSATVVQNGGSLSNFSTTDSGSIASVLLDGSATLNDIRINSEEAIRIGASGNVTINNSYLQTAGVGSDHADTIQTFVGGGGHGNVTITNSTIAASLSSQNSGMFVADGYYGNFTFNNVVFEGGPVGLKINADAGAGHDDSVALSNVYFVGPFQFDPFLFTKVNANIHITQWDNVRYATIVNGQLVPGALIPPPQPVEGGGTTTPPPTEPTQPTLAAPAITSGNHTTNDNTVTVTGTAAAGSTVTVFDGATKLGTVTVGSNGAWSYTTAALTDGNHSLTATDTSSGKTSVASSAVAITVDTHAPAAPVLVGDTVVNTNHVLLSGTAEANSAITVYDGATAVGTATAGSNGAWSVTTGVLATGSHVLTATASDAAGNTSGHSKALDPVIASPTTSAPVIASYSNDTGLAGDHITSDNTLVLTGTAAANTTVTVFDGVAKLGTATVDGSGAWHYVTAALNDGSHSLTATDTNASGHTSVASSAVAVTIDTHAPAAPTMAVDNETGKALSATTTADDFLLKGTAEANSTVHVFDDGKQIGTVAANSSGLWSFDIGHETDGSHSFTSTATDAAGNVSAASAAKNVMVDAPTSTSAVGITNLFENHHNDVVTITGTADANSQVKVYDGTKAVGTVEAGANGTWSYTSSAVSNITHTYSAQELDSHGHVVASSGNAILGTTGANTLTSTSGNDLFVGNGHPDTFVFVSNFGNDVIKDFSAAGSRGHDVVEFSKSVFDSFADVLSHATQSGHNVVIADGAGDSLTLNNVKLSALDKHDFHFA
jgi:hypothetical protein